MMITHDVSGSNVELNS